MNRFRPRVEGLEDRWTPDSYVWSPQPGSTDATVPANWRINGDPATDLPGADDDVQFEGSAADCTNFGTAGAYYLVYAGRGYTGTVTLASAFTVGQFTLESGAVRAGSAAHNITVTAQFVWTGGTLNSSAHLTSLVLDDATATIAPLNAGTVTTGSTLSFVNAATGSFSPGMVNCINSAVLSVAEACVLSIESVNFIQNPDAEDFNNGDITVRGTTSFGARVVNWMGTYRFVGQANVFLRGGGANAPAYSQVRSAANTYIESESKITVTNQDSYVQISGGHLSTLARAGAAVQTATIDGKLQLDGSGGQVDIVICDGSTPHVFGTLFVTGDINWQAGTFRPVVNASNPPEADLWRTSGKFTVGGQAQLAPGTINIPPGGMPANQLWLFLQGDDRIDGTPPAVIGGIYTVSPSGSPVKKWFFAT
jgi:hypothetical protein